MLAFSILALAFVIYWQGWKLIRVLGVIGMVLERVANRAAARSGEPPITTKADEERITSTF